MSANGRRLSPAWTRWASAYEKAAAQTRCISGNLRPEAVIRFFNSLKHLDSSKARVYKMNHNKYR